MPINNEAFPAVVMLERTCHELTNATSRRAINYAAVRNRVAAIRAADDQRPTVSSGSTGRPRPDSGPTTPDTTGARLAGIDAFDLDRLLKATTDGKEARQ